MKKFILVILLLYTLVFSFSWNAALKSSRSGNISLPPLRVVLVLKYHYPLSEIDGRFLDPNFFKLLADFYQILNSLSGKVIVAVSPSFLNQISDVSKNSMPDGNWKKNWLPSGFPKDNPNRSWKILSSSIAGKLIALISSGYVKISVIPLYSPPMGLLVESGFENHAISQTKIAFSQLSDIFGSVDCFYPPLLDISSEIVSRIVPKGSYSFASSKVLSHPVEISSVRLVPVDVDISKSLMSVKNEEDLSKVLGKIHSYQRLGKKGISIVLDFFKWMKTPLEIKLGILKALTSDPYIELSFPEDLEYRNIGYLNRYTIFGDPDYFYTQEPVLRLWDLFKGIFVTYLKSSHYAPPEKREKAKNILYALEDSTFYESVFTGDYKFVLKDFNHLAKKLYSILGEDSSSLPDALEFARMQITLERIFSSPVLNGVEDEGFWVYAKEFSNGGMNLKLVLLKKGILLSIYPGKDAKDLIGKSRILVVSYNGVEYRFYFKTWRKRIYLFKKGILSGKLMENFGVWKNVELLIKSDLPGSLFVEMLDSRSREVLSRIPESGYIRLDERR